MRGGTVTVSWVFMTLRAAETHGVSREAVLEDATFDLSVLTDPEGRIPFDAYLALLERTAHLTGAQDFGLQAGTYVRPDLHLTTLLVLNGPTLQAVYERMCGLSRFHWDRSKISIEDTGTVGRIDARIPTSLRHTQGLRHFVDSRLSIWMNFGRIALDEPWVPLRVNTPVATAASRARCEAYLGCPVTVGGNSILFEFDRALLHRPTKRQFQPLDAALRQLSRDMLASLDRQAGFAEETRKAIVANLAEKTSVTAAARAAALDLGVRTFERRLQREGTTYARLLEETRVRLACQLFTAPQLQLSEVAVLVGYSSAAAFNHAFRRVMSSTPSAVRKAMLEQRHTHLPTPETMLARPASPAEVLTESREPKPGASAVPPPPHSSRSPKSAG